MSDLSEKLAAIEALDVDVATMAKVLYIAAHWKDTISEPDGQKKPQAEYERRSAERWDSGKAGWSCYQRYPRYAAALKAAGFGLVREQAAKLAKVEALAEEWHKSGERDLATSKTIPDEHVSMALLTEGASMIENARHIQNALGDKA